ncbi:MerR family transcriptional regulator [Streptomyces roseiscleroticus]|nr:MerR family transcriptional regulator [Streptomyces ruber]
MTTDAQEPTLTVDELAARAGVTVRTVRFYGTRGLLPPPEIGPRRVGRYGREHLARLELIDALQRQGMTLAAVERYLRRLPPEPSVRDLAVHRAVVASWAPETVETVTRRELERLAGRALGDEDVARLGAMDVLSTVRDAREDSVDSVGSADSAGSSDVTYRVDTGLLPLGVQLLDVPLSQETIMAARTVLLDHSRAAAHALSRLLRDAVAERDPEAVRSLSADMEPLVVQALLTTFQRSLREELREWLRKP